ncbi:MFS transporter [Streptomyces goshikiensis]|uniref:MFS transporter n=1 Tax=Streptomyces goshikiensis TaxID=1942 RepID=UPI0036575999
MATSSDAQASAETGLSKKQINRAVAGVMTGLLLSALDQTVVSTALPSIVSDVGGLENLAWVITAYLLTSMASTPVWGKVSDQFGRRIVFIVATSVFIAGSVLCGVALVLVERRAAEPVVPMTLFRLRLFSLGSVYSLVAGLALFTGVVFLPVYFQAVKGMSPFVAGTAVVPTMIGVGFASVYAGNRMSATGRFRIFPVLGAVLLVATLLPLGFIDADTPSWLMILLGMVLGVGAGFTLQPIITAVQGVVAQEDIGAATAAVSFFQRLGSAVGVALLGAILTSRFASLLAERGGAALGVNEKSAGSVDTIRTLAPQQRELVVGAYGDALATVFLTVVPFAVLAVVLSLLMPETRIAADASVDAPADNAPEPETVSEKEQ